MKLDNDNSKSIYFFNLLLPISIKEKKIQILTDGQGDIDINQCLLDPSVNIWIHAIDSASAWQ